MKNSSRRHIETLVERYPNLEVCRGSVLKATEMLIEMYKNGGKLLVAGNGGSASDSLHIVGELMKGFCLPRKISQELREKINDEELSNSLQYGLPAISLCSESALFTAFLNDQGSEGVYAQGVLGYAKKEDVVLLISTSGNSKNCVAAMKVAKALGVKVVALTGARDSKLSEGADVTIKAPEIETYKIQELHLPIYHAICLALEEEFFGA